MKKILLASVLVSLSSAAFADTKFDGAYAGLNIGYARGDDKATETYQNVYYDTGSTNTPKDVFLGAFGGYNKVLENNLFVGIEADYEFRNADAKTVQSDITKTYPDFPVEVKINDAASLRARFGYVFNENNTLAYVTGGYAVAEIKRTYSWISQASSISDSKWQDGWTAGLGVEHFVTDKITAKAEYRYSDYGKHDINSDALYASTGYIEHHKYENEQSFRLGAAYHF